MINRLIIALWASALALVIVVLGHTGQSIYLAQVYTGPGLDGGVTLGSQVQGPLKGALDVTIVLVVNRLLTYVALAAVIAIIVAGLYMILTGGAQAEKAKTIILWTIVGLAVILLAKVIVTFVYLLLGGNPGEIGINVPSGTNPVAVVIGIVNNVLTYVGLAAVIAIVIAGLYMILSGGTQAEKAKTIIQWTLIGLVVILLAKVIIAFVYASVGGGVLGDVGLNIVNGTGDIRQIISNVLNTVLNFVGLLAVIAIVVAGIWLIVGFGSDDSRQRAQKIILYTIIGLIIILLAKLIVSIPGILVGV